MTDLSGTRIPLIEGLQPSISDSPSAQVSAQAGAHGIVHPGGWQVWRQSRAIGASCFAFPI